ncbi:hypothetical protein BHE74_00003831 [Ensete ventricosum]|nr:hypothetical protein BHE74_00003831 [Ensete ventricosum]
MVHLQAISVEGQESVVTDYILKSSKFFRHYLLLVLISQMASGLFRLLAAVGREMVVADTFGSSAQLVLLILSGFLISRGIELPIP